MFYSLRLSVCVAAVFLMALAPAPRPSLAPTVAPSPSTAVPAGVSVIVPDGTRILVSPTDKVSSANAQVGDVINVTATEDVVANGYIVVAKGAGGQAEVATVERAHGNGGSGKLGIKMDFITAVDGEKIKLSSTQKTSSEEDKGGGSSTATILSTVLLGPIGLFFHNFAHGRDVTIDSSKTLTAFTDGTVHVVATTKGGADPGFAHL